MISGSKYNIAQLGRAVTLFTSLGVLLLGITAANAASITGSMGVGGDFSASGGTDLSDATMLDLTSVIGTSGDGDIGGTVGFGTVGTIHNSPFTFNPAAPVTNLFQIGGWQVDLATMTVVDQTASILTIEGTGTISGNSFDPTPTQWTLSANTMGSSYSMTVSAVPVPAAVWLFGSGLVGLIGVARRKAA